MRFFNIKKARTRALDGRLNTNTSGHSHHELIFPLRLAGAELFHEFLRLLISGKFPQSARVPHPWSRLFCSKILSAESLGTVFAVYTLFHSTGMFNENCGEESNFFHSPALKAPRGRRKSRGKVFFVFIFRSGKRKNCFCSILINNVENLIFRTRFPHHLAPGGGKGEEAHTKKTFWRQ